LRANHTVTVNASVVKIYKATRRLARLRIKLNFLLRTNDQGYNNAGVEVVYPEVVGLGPGKSEAGS
jgi:hypothetical protein